jgi:hypothetical protein
MAAVAPPFDHTAEDLVGRPGHPFVNFLRAFESSGRVPARDQPALTGQELDRLKLDHASALRGPSLDGRLIPLGLCAEGGGEAD